MTETPKKDRAAKYIHPKSDWYQPRKPARYFGFKKWEMITSLLGRMRRGEDLRRHTHVSRDAYEAYDDWEMRAYEQGSVFTLAHGRMRRISLAEVRDGYLAPVMAEIQELRQAGHPVRVLEVGCGNGTNLMVLKRAFPDGVDLHGIDISPERMRQGFDYWGDRLAGVTMTPDSATTLQTQPHDSFDIVFSLHCLEQVPYAVGDCIDAMVRVCRHRIVFVEPTWEFANDAQRLYTLFGDQLRTLIPELNARDLSILSSKPAAVLANPLNQTGITVVQV